MTLFMILVWLVPISFALHYVEEFIWPGGFIAWYHDYRPVFAQQRNAYYVKVNVIAISVVTLVTIHSAMTHNYVGSLIASGALASNATFTHVLGSFKTQRHSPGIITGLVLYLPIWLLLCILAINLNLVNGFQLTISVLAGPLYELWLFIRYTYKTIRA